MVGDMHSDIYNATRQRIEKLWNACIEGDLPALEALLDEGLYDVDGGNYWQSDIDPRAWRRTPLHAAVLGGHQDLAAFLLAAGADPDRRTKYGDTPLHFAVDAGRADLVEALLAAGAGRGLTNDDDETPLDRARKVRNRALEKLLEAPPSD